MKQSFKMVWKNILALMIGILISLILAELVLNIYNPYPSRFRGDKIQLKTNFQREVVLQTKIPGLDSIIHYSVNGLGFRGEEFPDSPDDYYKIITVGGSTTENSMQDDKKTWPELLGNKLKESNEKIWINNGGIAGATTYGHNILMDDYILKLKPDMVIFLIGINDRGKSDFSKEDGNLIDREESFTRKLVKSSEVANLINNLVLMYKTKKVDIGHNFGKDGKPKYVGIQPNPEVDSTRLAEVLSPHIQPAEGYAKRVSQLAEKCIKNDIKPVFVTQPLVYGGEAWKVMEFYNHKVMELCESEGWDCIDLGELMAKDGRFFYDAMHFTNEGSQEVARILYDHLDPIVNQQ